MTHRLLKNIYADVEMGIGNKRINYSAFVVDHFVRTPLELQNLLNSTTNTLLKSSGMNKSHTIKLKEEVKKQIIVVDRKTVFQKETPFINQI